MPYSRTDGLVINAAVLPGRGEDVLAEDIAVVKAGILYGDRVRLYSPVASLILPLTYVGQLSIAEMALVWATIAEQLGHSQLSFLQEFRTLPRSLRREFRQRWEKQLRREFSKLQRVAEGYGGTELRRALEAGFLEVDLVDWQELLEAGADIETNPCLQFLKTLLEEPRQYPLFNRTVAELVAAAVRDGIISPQERAITTGRRVALSSGILTALPTFEAASMDEVLDIRRELSPPLRRFRSAIIELADGGLTAPWDEGFQHEVEDILVKEIQPALVDIQERCRENAYLRKLVPELISEAAATAMATSGLLLGLSPGEDIIKAAWGLAALAGLGSVIRSYKAQAEATAEIRRHRFYFVYEASRRLGSLSS